MKPAPRCPPRSQIGFTLIEVVIATALAAMVMAGLVASMRTFGASLSKTEERVEKLDEMRLGSEFLRRVLEAPVTDIRRAPVDGKTALHFAGSADSIVLLGNLPARNGLGGLSLIRIAARDEGGARNLLLQSVPYAGEDRGAPLDDAEPQLIIGHIDAWRIAYRDPTTREWAPQWTETERLPDMLRIEIEREGRRWPDIVVALRPLGALP